MDGQMCNASNQDFFPLYHWNINVLNWTHKKYVTFFIMLLYIFNHIFVQIIQWFCVILKLKLWALFVRSFIKIAWMATVCHFQLAKLRVVAVSGSGGKGSLCTKIWWGFNFLETPIALNVAPKLLALLFWFWNFRFTLYVVLFPIVWLNLYDHTGNSNMPLPIGFAVLFCSFALILALN